MISNRLWSDPITFQTDAATRGGTEEPNHPTVDTAEAHVRFFEPSQSVCQRVDKRNIPHAPDIRMRLVHFDRHSVSRNRVQHVHEPPRVSPSPTQKYRHLFRVQRMMNRVHNTYCCYSTVPRRRNILLRCYARFIQIGNFITHRKKIRLTYFTANVVIFIAL